MMFISKKNQPELLSPAGNLEKAKIAIDFGADAVFIGGKWFSLRARASNFGKKEIIEIVNYAKLKNKKIYVAANIFCHNINLHGAKRYFQFLKDTGVDAIIVADPFLMEIAKEINLEIHISTQQSITNSAAARFWFKNGSPRVVTAREVTGQELREMISKTPYIEYEYFIHGAVCIAYSGRCTMSNHFTNRDSNRGGCAHSCRWMYNTKGNTPSCGSGAVDFTMSAKDSALISDLTDLIDMGVKSFKIEGRMKSLHYVATITTAYRKAIDSIIYTGSYNKKDAYEEISKAVNRDVDSNFFYGTPGPKTQFYGNLNLKTPNQNFLLTVDDIKDNQLILATVRNKFYKTDKIEFFGSDFDNVICNILELYDQNMNKIDFANKPMSQVYLKIDQKITSNAMARRFNFKK